MRSLLAIVLLVATACTEARQPPAPTAAPATRASTLAVAFLDQIDSAPATRLAVGGKLRIRVPDGQVTATNAFGPFSIAQSTGFDTFVIKATGAGTGQIEIETPTGYARISLAAAPIASVEIEFDNVAMSRRATVKLRDSEGTRLVDASLRVAPGSAPVAFLRDTWDAVELDARPPGGDVLVKTDLLGTTRAAITNVTPAKTTLAKR